MASRWVTSESLSEDESIRWVTSGSLIWVTNLVRDSYGLARHHRVASIIWFTSESLMWVTNMGRDSYVLAGDLYIGGH